MRPLNRRLPQELFFSSSQSVKRRTEIKHEILKYRYNIMVLFHNNMYSGWSMNVLVVSINIACLQTILLCCFGLVFKY